MFCPHCYAETPDDLDKCSSCGKSVLGGAPPPPEPSSEPYYSGGSYGAGSSVAAEAYPPLGALDYVQRPFKDPEAFKKIIIGGLLTASVIGVLAVTGYAIEYIRKIIRRENPETLPEWDAWGGYFVTGLVLLLVGFIYMFVIGGIGVGVSVPFWGAIALAFNNMDSSPEGWAEAMSLFSAMMIPLLIIGFILFIVGFVMPALQVLFARQQNFADFFNIPAAIRLIMTDIVDYLVALLAVFVVYLIGQAISGFFGFILSIIPFLGSLVALVILCIVSFAISLVSASSYAEFYYKHHRQAEL